MMIRLLNAEQHKARVCWKREFAIGFATIFAFLVMSICGKAAIAQDYGWALNESDQKEFQKLSALYEISWDEARDWGFSQSIPAQSQNNLWRMFRALRRCKPELATHAGSNAKLPVWEGKLVSITGRLVRVESLPLPIDLQESFGESQYHRCEILLADQARPSVVYALHVPKALEDYAAEEQPMAGQPVTCWGGVTVVDNAAESVRIAMISSRLRWRPNVANPKLGIEAHHLGLAEQGIDLDELLAVQDGTQLSFHDHESFYQLLRAAKRWPSSWLNEAVSRPDIGQLLKQPTSQRGRVFHVRGVARRILPIYVDDAEAMDFGVNRYFELEVMTEVDPSIRIDAGSTSRLFSRYPVVLCAVTLPAGMPTGDDVHEPVEFTGVFFKNWSYPAAWLSRADAPYLQSSPLLIGKQPIWLTSETGDSYSGSLLNWIAFIVVLGIVGFGWQVARWNRQFVDQQRKRRVSSELPNWDEFHVDP